ncbi:MAG: AAA family ATPase [Candidatus Saccharibacteria bacterium]
MKPSEIAKPHMIIMVGIPGSGKSFFAENFAQTFKAPIISFSKIYQELFTKPTNGEHEYEIVLRAAQLMFNQIIKTKKTIIYDGPSSKRSDRNCLDKIAKEAGYQPIFIWVQTELLAAKKRALKPTNGQLAMTSDQFEIRMKQFSPPHPNEPTVVISGKHTYNTQLKIVLKSMIIPPPNTSPAVRSNKINNFLIR